tara:strand:- start:763 stop:1698 length:936 start_codon:yes stop_codon:yes gene_type:complete
MTEVIKTTSLTKQYGEFTAVDRLDLSIEQGEVFGFLGPNGAGKTTTILMLLGLTSPTNGSATIYGYDCTRNPLSVKRITGYLPENVGFYGELSAEDNLRYTASLNKIEGEESRQRIKQVLEDVGLIERAKQPVQQYSRGMRQRLGIADVLLKRPKVVILDEPTQGIDPASVPELLEIIRRMSQEHKITVVLSSHQLHYVQRICSRVAIMSKGKAVMQGNVDELSQKVMGGEDIVVDLEVEKLTPEITNSLSALSGVTKVTSNGNMITVECSRGVKKELASSVISNAGTVLTLRSADSVLEEIYLRYFSGER